MVAMGPKISDSEIQDHLAPIMAPLIECIQKRLTTEGKMNGENSHLEIVTGPSRGSLGASFLLADWQVRVFWPSGFVERPSERLYVRNIPLSGCTDIRPLYTSFYSQAWLSIW